MSYFVIPSVLLLTGLIASVTVGVHGVLRGRAIADRPAPLPDDERPRPGRSRSPHRQSDGPGKALPTVFADTRDRLSADSASEARHSPTARGWYVFWILLVAAVLVSHSAILGDSAARTVGDLAQALSALAASALCFHADHRSRRRHVPRVGSRSGWFFLAIASACWGVGQLIWTWLEIVDGENVPFPSYADIGYLLALPCTALALVVFRPTPRGAAPRFRALFDGSIIALSMFGIAWSTVLGPFIFHADQPWLKRILSIIYPLFDVFNCSIALATIARSRMRNIRSIILVAVGLGALTTADTMFLYLSEKNSYQTGSWTDLGWVFCYTAFGFGAVCSRETLGPEESRISISAWRAVVPYAALGFAVLSAVLMEAITGAISSFVFFDGIIILSLIALRQVALIREGIRLGQSLERIAIAVADETPLREASEELRTIRAGFDEQSVSTERLGEVAERLRMVTRSTEDYQIRVARIVTEAASVARSTILER